MRIATWNVNSLRIRLSHVCHWLDTHQPDVLLLQETKVTDDDFPYDPFIERGYLSAVHGQKSYNGVAILSRHRLAGIQSGLSDLAEPDQCRVLAATLNVPGSAYDGLRVISAYIPNGGSLDSEKFRYKEAFYQRLTTYLRAEQTAHSFLVLGGDFNIAAHARDTDDPDLRVHEVLFTPAEQAWLANLQRQANLQDALRVLHPEGQHFSWWDYRAGALVKNQGMRIDYLFLSATLTDRIAAVVHHAEERHRPQPSDHIPVMLTLT